VDFLLWVHLLGAALWLGGLVTLALAVVLAFRTLPREHARAYVRSAGRAFAALSAVAWLLLAVSGLPFAAQRHWPQLVLEKVGLAVVVLLATVVHTLLGMRTASRPAVLASRALSVLIFAGTLYLFWMGVELAA
jgi:putative copper export protein